jgi:hypothetical protein
MGNERFNLENFSSFIFPLAVTSAFLLSPSASKQSQLVLSLEN